MVAHLFPESLKTRLLPAVAILAGVGVAIGIATAPGATLNGAVERSGIVALVPAAATPIGATGRTVIALVAGAMVALMGLAARWRLPATPAASPSAPVVRRADAHPDAPPRRPIRASADLGDPLPIAAPTEPRPAKAPAPPAEQAIPADLDTPLSAVDPAALPAEPLEPVRALPPLTRIVAPPLDPGERIETFHPAPAPRGDETIADLLTRLEAAAAQRPLRRTAAPAELPETGEETREDLSETLQKLRRLAAG